MIIACLGVTVGLVVAAVWRGKTPEKAPAPGEVAGDEPLAGEAQQAAEVVENRAARPQERVKAAELLAARTGRNSAKAALAALEKGLKDDDAGVREAVATAIVKIGPAKEALRALVRALEDPRVPVQLLAVTKVAEVGNSDDEAVLPLVVAYASRDPAVSEAAFVALNRLTGGTQQWVARVPPAVRENRLAGDHAAVALVRATQRDESVIPLLVADIADLRITSFLQGVLARSPPKATMRELVRAMQNEELKPFVMVIVEKMRDRTGGALAAVAEDLTDRDPKVREAAIHALRRTSGGLPKLIEAMGDEDPELQELAAGFVRARLPRTELLIVGEIVKHGLGSPKARVRAKSCQLIGQIGITAAPAIPELAKLLDDPDKATAIEAAAALAAMRRGGRRVLAQMGQALERAKAAGKAELVTAITKAMDEINQ